MGHHWLDQRFPTLHRVGRHVPLPTLIPREFPPDLARMWARANQQRPSVFSGADDSLSSCLETLGIVRRKDAHE
ncbi:hypothetical protein MBT84_14660 [Streptomyces sp. MBT84]|nr:hypothetical protein [Streptomyces sp. MBT84]